MGKHFSFIHCADLHLGEPFSDIRMGSSGPWNEQIGKATFKAFEKVVDAALENRVDAILISGDVYNGDHHSLAAQMSFARELYRAAQGGIEVFIVHGNHDPGEAWRADIPLPETVHIFPADKVTSFPLMKDGEKAATIYGISYKTRHVKENLALQFHREKDDGFAIGMLHTEAGAASSPYAPCTVDDLKAAGMDYWALGHVHTRKTLSTSPYIVYPGNTQGLSLEETGVRGCYLVDVGAYGTVTLKFIETDVIRWMDMVVDISPFSQTEELIQAVTKRRSGLKELTGRPNIIRLVCTGSGPLHKILSTEDGRDFILQSLNDKEQFRYLFAWFVRLEDRTRSLLHLEERRELPDVTGNFLKAFDAVNQMDPEKKKEELRRTAEKQPEFVKYKKLLQSLSDEDLLYAFQKSELLGAEMLTEEEEDNENH